MVTFLSWVLLIVAVVDVVYAVWQLLLLDGMKIIINEMNVGRKWRTVVGPSGAVLVLSILAVVNHELTLLWLPLGILSLVVTFIYQMAMRQAIRDIQHKDWDEKNERLLRVTERH